MKVVEIIINGKKVTIELDEYDRIDKESLKIVKRAFKRYDKAFKVLRNK